MYILLAAATAKSTLQWNNKNLKQTYQVKPWIECCLMCGKFHKSWLFSPQE